MGEISVCGEPKFPRLTPISLPYICFTTESETWSSRNFEMMLTDPKEYFFSPIRKDQSTSPTSRRSS